MTPFNITVRVPPLTLATVSSALFGPGEVARNPTLAVVLASGASSVTPGGVAENAAASAPPTVDCGDSVTSLASPFAIVSAADAAMPGSPDPTSMHAGVTTMPGVPAPERSTVVAPRPGWTVRCALTGATVPGRNTTG